MAITVVIALDIPILFFPSFGPGSLYSLISWYSFILALIPFPLSISFAVQRSRLWDIDNIINRTLVYTLLTALLALVYFGSVTLLQYLFRSFTGQGSLRLTGDFHANLGRSRRNSTRTLLARFRSVNEAMEPEYVSLWINKPEPESEVPRYTGVLQQ